MSDLSVSLLNFRLEPDASLSFSGQYDFVFVERASTSFLLSLNDGPEVLFRHGQQYRPPPGVRITRFRVHNPAVEALDLSLRLALGDFRDHALSFVGELPIAAASALSTTADVTLAAGARTQIVSANAGRKAVLVTNFPGNPSIRLGDDKTAAGRGALVSGGAALEIQATSAVYGFSPSAARVGVLEAL